MLVPLQETAPLLEDELLEDPPEEELDKPLEEELDEDELPEELEDELLEDDETVLQGLYSII